MNIEPRKPFEIPPKTSTDLQTHGHQKSEPIYLFAPDYSQLKWELLTKIRGRASSHIELIAQTAICDTNLSYKLVENQHCQVKGTIVDSPKTILKGCLFAFQGCDVPQLNAEDLIFRKAFPPYQHLSIGTRRTDRYFAPYTLYRDPPIQDILYPVFVPQKSCSELFIQYHFSVRQGLNAFLPGIKMMPHSPREGKGLRFRKIAFDNEHKLKGTVYKICLSEFEQLRTMKERPNPSVIEKPVRIYDASEVKTINALVFCYETYRRLPEDKDPSIADLFHNWVTTPLYQTFLPRL